MAVFFSPYFFVTTVLLTSLGKTFFVWRFILKGKYFVPTVTISYKKTFVFSVSVFGFQIFIVNLN